MSGIVAKIKHEILEVIPPTIFFFVAIGLLILTKRLMLQQYGIEFADFGAAVIGALIIAKVVLIVDYFPFINKFPNKPLIYNVLWKTAIYVVAAFIVRLAEHFIPLVVRYGSIREAASHMLDDVVWPQFLIIYIWLSVLLFVYCSLRELVRAIGKDEVLTLFFGVVRGTRETDVPVRGK